MMPKEHGEWSVLEMQAQAWAAGVQNWAWWKDGVQYVGTCGMTLQDALLKNPYVQITSPQEQRDA